MNILQIEYIYNIRILNFIIISINTPRVFLTFSESQDHYTQYTVGNYSKIYIFFQYIQMETIISYLN